MVFALTGRWWGSGSGLGLEGIWISGRGLEWRLFWGWVGVGVGILGGAFVRVFNVAFRVESLYSMLVNSRIHSGLYFFYFAGNFFVAVS